MTDETRKLLTEYLWECWHEFDLQNSFLCIRGCGEPYASEKWPSQNRPFTTQPDMMDLYGRLWVKGDWGRFEKYARDVWYTKTDDYTSHSWLPWLFCLSGSGYEERCQVVGDWLTTKTQPLKINDNGGVKPKGILKEPCKPRDGE